MPSLNNEHPERLALALGLKWAFHHLPIFVADTGIDRCPMSVIAIFQQATICGSAEEAHDTPSRVVLEHGSASPQTRKDIAPAGF